MSESIDKKITILTGDYYYTLTNKCQYLFWDFFVKNPRPGQVFPGRGYTK
ncbi:hypothetical protein BACCAP_02246 [Pseudoflavonifractor capillosus ATCC 29799]|uniref:Uncharacterized protein n=1 Tax=Pseudoflavonifractor capillosus ATCC 29799 TaxID=411467 RepID=A6NVK4_9FIRM|nr:hypothetical protein BACCAP_02246 [Pseudoflavonifractor capillosus ATCC 29799]